MEDVEEVNEEEEESSEPSSAPEEFKNSSGFTIISNTDLQPSQSSFSMIDTSAKAGQDDKTESFEVIGDSASSIAADDKPFKAGGAKSQMSGTSYSSAMQNVINSGVRGKTRQEAFDNLNIQKAELMSTGEIRLPDGKIIGHRDHKHIYR